MSAQRTSRLPGEIRRVIDHYRRRWRAVTVETGFFVTLGVLACTVGLAIAADRLLRLTPQFRTVTLVTILSLGGLCLARRVLWPAVRRLRDREAAARLGHSFPKVEEDLVSAVELSELLPRVSTPREGRSRGSHDYPPAGAEARGREDEGISQGLLRSALGQIVDRTRAVDYRRAVPVRPLLKAGAAVLVVLAILFGAYEIRPDAVRNALARLFKPAAGVPYYSYTQLDVNPPDGYVVRVGDSLDVAIATKGRLASTARLDGRKGEGAAAADRFSVRLTCEQGAAHWVSGPLFRDIAYRVTAGDAISDWHRVRVLPPPSLSQKSTTLRSPAYAGSRMSTLEKVEGPIQVVEGSELVIRVAVANRGDDAMLQCTGEMRQGSQSWTLSQTAPGVLVSAAFRPTVTGEYVITLTDGFGLRNRTPESVFIRVVPDRVPVVAITSPGRDLLLLPGETFAIEANARDEFGIRSLDLAYHLIRAKASEDDEETADRWQRRVLKEGGPAAAELAARTEVGMDDLGMVPGDNLEYKAEGADYMDDAVLRRGASPVYRVTVLSHMEHLERILARLKELQLELLRRAMGEKAQAAKAEKLAEAGEKAPREEARAAQNSELEHARATEQLARQLDGLIPELARNPVTPTDMLAQMERLGRGTRSVADEPMQQAAQKFGQAADSQQNPSPNLQSAQQNASDAQRRLEQLAQLAQRMQRNAILERLAAQAEALAARQRELKDKLVAPLAVDTAGAELKDLSRSHKARLQRIVMAQREINDGIISLGKDIEKAAADIAFSSPADAATATEAKGKLDEDKTANRAGNISRQLAGGVLFSQLPEQEEVAMSLIAVAEILRRRTIGEELEAIAKELEEFIRRQREINGNIEASIKKEEKSLRPNELGSKQANLQRDVTEQASALHWLAREIAAFRSATADKLDAAAKEMGEGATDLYGKALPEGLEHGKKALALLEDAREQFKNDSQQMQKAAQDAQMIQALLLLQRVIVGQKRVNSATARADELRVQASKDFDHVVIDVAARQSEVRGGAKKLQKLLERFRDAAALVGESGKKMDLSRVSLGAGDTGTDTRTVQRQALALLEALLKDQQGGGGGGGGGRIGAIMGMMAGSSPGGFTGGSNAPVMPTPLGDAKDEGWRRARSRFDEQLGAAFEARFPAEYRALLNAYFDRLRKEPSK